MTTLSWILCIGGVILLFVAVSEQIPGHYTLPEIHELVAKHELDTAQIKVRKLTQKLWRPMSVE